MTSWLLDRAVLRWLDQWSAVLQSQLGSQPCFMSRRWTFQVCQADFRMLQSFSWNILPSGGLDLKMVDVGMKVEVGMFYIAD